MVKTQVNIFLASLPAPPVDIPIFIDVTIILPDFQIGNFVFRFDFSLSFCSPTQCPFHLLHSIAIVTLKVTYSLSHPWHPLKSPSMY